ncbi:MAG: hypothetical protein QOG20_3939, partial [Pseudonocardiales bacterium]|nr:hypothetical protein [Pseudonocardiales bacterium]
NHFLGLRLNDWTSLLVLAAAVAYLLLRRGSRGQTVPPPSVRENQP